MACLALPFPNRCPLCDGLGGAGNSARDSWFEERQHHWHNAARHAEEEVVRAKAELSNRRFEDFSGAFPIAAFRKKRGPAKRGWNIARSRWRWFADGVSVCPD